MQLLSVTMNDGVKLRSELDGKDNSSEDKSNYKKVCVGDMVYNSMRMWQGANGVSEFEGIVSPAYTVLKPEANINNEYFAKLFKNTKLINEFRKNSQGLTSDTWNLKYQQIAPIKIKIPEINEQNKIAEFLSLVDKRIDKQRQLVENLKKYKRGLLINIFEDTTSNWTSQKLGDICSYRRGSFPQPYGLPMWYDDKNGMPFIQVADVNDDMTVNIKTKRRISEVAKSKSVFIPKGTLIVTLQGTIGRVAITTFNAYIDRTLLVVQNISQNVLKEFLMLAIYMKFNIEKQTADGSIIKTITKETLTDFYIKLPTIEFQEKIVALMNHYNKILYLETQKLNNLIKVKQGLLQQMFI